ncbi:MAG: hypothetical protein ABWZ80_07350 [Beijerinckiaceae bacterium]
MAFQSFLQSAREDAGLVHDAAAQALPNTSALSGFRPLINAQELLSMLVGMRGRFRAVAAPRAHIRMSVYLPDGRPAVEISLGGR